MSDRLRGLLAFVLPAICYSLFIFLMSSLSAPPTPTFNLEWGDKITHAGAFGLMMLFTFRATRWLFSNRTLGMQIVLAALYCIVYGATDEIHQYFVPGRSCDIFDWIADTTGTLLGAAFILTVLRYRIGRIIFGAAEPRDARA